MNTYLVTFIETVTVKADGVREAEVVATEYRDAGFETAVRGVDVELISTRYAVTTKTISQED